MSRAITFCRQGTVLDGPRKSRAPRVFIDGGHDQGYAISGDGLRILRDDLDARLQFISVALDFRSFLDHWLFTSPGQSPRLLGADLWPSQEQFVAAVNEHEWVYFLKARQLGESTIAVAWDGWVARFGPANSRVHIFSQKESVAQDFLDDVVRRLEGLPEFMRLPLTATKSKATLAAGVKDARVVESFPASNATRGSSAVHVHLDEWAAMTDPLRVWQAIEPTCAGSMHVLTTGQGPVGVAIVLDATEGVVDVVDMLVLDGAGYPEIQMQLERLAAKWPRTKLVIEANAMGAAVIQNLDLPSHRIVPFVTTGVSKQRIISNLKFEIEQWRIQWSPEQCGRLDQEMRSYKEPDTNVRQDCVMSLALALEGIIAGHLPPRGRAIGPILTFS